MKKIVILIGLIIISSCLQADWVDLDSRSEELFSCQSSNRANTVIEFQLNGYEIENIIENGIQYSKITHPTQGYLLETGKPDLPVFTTLVAISGQGTPLVSYSEESEILLSDYKPYPQQELRLENEPPDNDFFIDQDYYSSNVIFPSESIVLGEPAIMRDLRIVPVTVQPFRYYPTEDRIEIITTFRIEINIENSPGSNELRESRVLSRAFEPFYRAHIINYELTRSRDGFQQPSILFIYPNQNLVANNLQYLVDWKHQRGYDVHTVSTSQTGSSSTQIKNYIQTAYNNWVNPPEYVVLVGDAGGSYYIPTWTDNWSSYSGEGDQPYSLLSGGDVLADVIVGRMAFNSINELQTLLSKSINYESNVYINNLDWFESFILCGDPSDSGPSTISTCRYVQDVSRNFNPDFEYTEIFSGNYSSQMSSALNNGALYFCYRGFYNMSGFNNSSINYLSNGWMLPFTSILTCDTGGFTGNCRSEQFAKAGSPNNPKGAIAAVGTATTGTHTCFNNCVTAGMFEGIFTHNIFTPGGALVNGKFNLYLNYPQNPDHFVNIFSHWNNLMGDPSVSLYTGIPQELTVDNPAEVGSGTTNYPVTVYDENGQPLPEAWVTILKGDDEIFSTGFTDENGSIWFPLDPDVSGSVTLTVTAHDFIAHQSEFVITDADYQLNPRNFIIDDDDNGSSSGNGDGLVNNGETIELNVSVNNTGSQEADDVTAEISCDHPFVEIITASAEYPDIRPGEEVNSINGFLIHIDPAMTGRREITLNVGITSQNRTFENIIHIPVHAPLISFNEYEISDVGSVIDPGENGYLTVILDNLGETSTGNLNAVLESDDPFIEIIDHQGSYNDILPGSQQNNEDNNFEISLSSVSIPGSMIPIILTVNGADGFSQEILFNIEVGSVTVSDPLGPDAYGYLCYDDQDTQYMECPEYNWIEINPGNGGQGNQVNIYSNGNDCDIADVYLPGNFNFNFYGHHYNMFTVGTAGWIAPGGTQNRSFMNWHLPDAHGPSPMIAAFWDDLHNGGGQVFTYYDQDMHYYIIEWYHFQNEVSNAEETFQIILYDATYYPTSTMDSPIKIQYQEFNNVNTGYYRIEHGQYCTVGLENESGLIGLEYSFNNTYPTAARTITDETALLFTTMPVPPEGPYLSIGEIVINDENGNGNADYGESVDLDILVSNIGSETARNVNVSVSSNDQYITLGNTYSDYPEIADGAMEANSIPFGFTVDAIVPDGHNASFNIVINCDEGQWEMFYEIELNYPDFDYLDYFVNDGVDNILDPGETADVLVNFTNRGGASIYDAEISLSTNDSYLSILDNQFSLGNIPGNENATGIFSFFAAVNSPQGHEAVVYYELNAGQNYSESGSFAFVISQIPVLINEDFSGSFPPDGWFVDGQNWSNGSSSNAGGIAPEAKFNWSPECNGDQRLVCGPISTSGASELDLYFRQSVDHYSGTYDLKLETSSNGSVWNEAAGWPAQNQSATSSYVNINNDDVGSSSFYLAFTFSGTSYNIDYWYIDDVQLESINMQPLGYIEGLVTLSGPGELTDVEISIADQTVHPTDSGYYCIIITPGTYTLTASLEGFDDFVVNDLIVQETLITQQNIVFGFIPSPENLTATVQENGVLLNWELSEEFTRRETRDLQYYNVYYSFNGNDFELAGISTDPDYFDQPYLPGYYTYYIRAFYSDIGETLPSNQATVWYPGEINFGDVSENNGTASYDAALILQYFVGFDPLPEIDPIPWEEYRIYLGDVDGNGILESFDASLIMKYLVGSIDHFPVEPDYVIRKRPAMQQKITNSIKQ